GCLGGRIALLSRRTATPATGLSLFERRCRDHAFARCLRHRIARRDPPLCARPALLLRHEARHVACFEVHEVLRDRVTRGRFAVLATTTDDQSSAENRRRSLHTKASYSNDLRSSRLAAFNCF